MGYSETPTKGTAMPEFMYPVLIALFLCVAYGVINIPRSTKK